MRRAPGEDLGRVAVAPMPPALARGTSRAPWALAHPHRRPPGIRPAPGNASLARQAGVPLPAARGAGGGDGAPGLPARQSARPATRDRLYGPKRLRRYPGRAIQDSAQQGLWVRRTQRGEQLQLVTQPPITVKVLRRTEVRQAL